MSRFRAVAVTLVLATPVACHATRGLPCARPPVTPDYRVVVAIVVDQLAAWVMAERARELPASGGFARLAREGLYAREMQFQHAVTETAFCQPL